MVRSSSRGRRFYLQTPQLLTLSQLGCIERQRRLARHPTEALLS